MKKDLGCLLSLMNSWQIHQNSCFTIDELHQNFPNVSGSVVAMTKMVTGSSVKLYIEHIFRARQCWKWLRLCWAKRQQPPFSACCPGFTLDNRNIFNLKSVRWKDIIDTLKDTFKVQTALHFTDFWGISEGPILYYVTREKPYHKNSKKEVDSRAKPLWCRYTGLMHSRMCDECSLVWYVTDFMALVATNNLLPRPCDWLSTEWQITFCHWPCPRLFLLLPCE